MRIIDGSSDGCSSDLLNLLQVFDAIHAKGGVSAAARHLNLSQPAISHALAKLRVPPGDPLFVRQGNRLVPTSAARQSPGPVREATRGQLGRAQCRVRVCPDASVQGVAVSIKNK